MAWQTFIESNPRVLNGKPALRGTRLSVEFVLERLANGWSAQDLYDNYPSLTPERLQAVFAFANDMLADTRFYAAPRQNAA